MWKLFEDLRRKDKWLIALIFLLLIVRLSLLSVFHHYCYMCYSAALQGEVAANLLDGKFVYAGGYSGVEKLQTETGKLVDLRDISKDTNPRYDPFVLNMPGYGILLAFLWEIFSEKRYIYAQLFQVLLDAISFLAFYYIAKKIFNEKIARISSMIYVFFLPVAYISVVAFRNIFPFFASIFSAYLIFRVLEDKSLNRINYYFFTGIVVGLFTWLRETNAALPIFLGLIAFAEYGGKEWLKATAIMLFGMLLVLSPWIIRNYVVFHQIVPLSTEMGLGWVAGFGEYANPWGIEFVDSVAHEYVLIRSKGYDVKFLSPEYDLMAKKVAISMILEQPGLYIEDVAKRFSRGVLLQPNPKSVSYLLSAGADSIRRVALALFSIFSILSAGYYLFFERKIKKSYLLLIMLPMLYFPLIYAPFNMVLAHALAGAWSYYILFSSGIVLLASKFKFKKNKDSG